MFWARKNFGLGDWSLQKQQFDWMARQAGTKKDQFLMISEKRDDHTFIYAGAPDKRPLDRLHGFEPFGAELLPKVASLELGDANYFHRFFKSPDHP